MNYSIFNGGKVHYTDSGWARLSAPPPPCNLKLTGEYKWDNNIDRREFKPCQEDTVVQSNKKLYPCDF